MRFGPTVALDGIELSLAPGEAVALIGPSGAGKTTLLRLLNASLRPSAGTVRISGRDPTRLSKRELRRLRSRLGTVHQDPSLVPQLRVLSNVLVGRLGRRSLAASLRLLWLPPAAEVRRAHALLERVGIGEKLYQRTDELSGGQRQRVAIARALYQEPLALVADEPISSLDPARARDTMGLLLEVCREEGLTFCASLHDLAVARELFPRLVGLRGGRIAFDRATATLDDADFARLYDLEPAADEDRGPRGPEPGTDRHLRRPSPMSRAR